MHCLQRDLKQLLMQFHQKFNSLLQQSNLILYHWLFEYTIWQGCLNFSIPCLRQQSIQKGKCTTGCQFFHKFRIFFLILSVSRSYQPYLLSPIFLQFMRVPSFYEAQPSFYKVFCCCCCITGSRKIGSIDMLYFYHSILSIFNCQTNSVAVLETAQLHPYQHHFNFLEVSKLLVSFLLFGVLFKVIVIQTLGRHLLLKFQPINLLVDHIQDYYHCKDVKRRFCCITLLFSSEASTQLADLLL